MVLAQQFYGNRRDILFAWASHSLATIQTKPPVQSRVGVLSTARDAISWTPPQARNDGLLRVIRYGAFQLGCAGVRAVARWRGRFGACCCALRRCGVADRVVVWLVRVRVGVSVPWRVRMVVCCRRELCPGAVGLVNSLCRL